MPRFTLTTMMLILLVSAMTAAGFRYMVMGLASNQTSGRAIFVISVLMLPMAVMMVANLFRLSLLWAKRRR